jgi:glycosyltransferase involved in cell wall biosynthesis
MRILLSAYACEPDKGSEPGIGWNWAMEIANLGHECWVLTRENNVDSTLAAARVRCPTLKVVGYDLPRWARFWKRGLRGVSLYYRLWQWGAYRRAATLMRTERFQVVHHVTFGVFRQPSFMGRLGIPFVIGFGGAEGMPRQFFATIPLTAQIKELVRDLAIAVGRIDPMVRFGLNRASLILCRTPMTREILPAAIRDRAIVMEDVGTLEEKINREGTRNISTPQFLFVGRLLAWKGLHIAFESLAVLRQRIPDATITVAGAGTDEKWLRSRAQSLGLESAVRWVGNLSHADTLKLYDSHLAFVFPSLHDAGPLVIPEAYARGLPVICLDYAGPGQLLPDGCGFKIPVNGRSRRQVVEGISEAMASLATSPGLRQQLSANCVRAAEIHTWKNLVAKTYQLIETRLQERH